MKAAPLRFPGFDTLRHNRVITSLHKKVGHDFVVRLEERHGCVCKFLPVQNLAVVEDILKVAEDEVRDKKVHWLAVVEQVITAAMNVSPINALVMGNAIKTAIRQHVASSTTKH